MENISKSDKPFDLTVQEAASSLSDEEFSKIQLEMMSAMSRSGEITEPEKLIERGSESQRLFLAAMLSGKGSIYVSYSTFKGSTLGSKEDVFAALLKKELTLAEERGVVWNQPLDFLASEGKHWANATEEQGVPSISEQAEKLSGWIKEQTSIAPLLELLKFQAKEVHRMVARYTSVVTPDLVDALKEDAHLSQIMVENPASSGSVRENTMHRLYRKWRKDFITKTSNNTRRRTSYGRRSFQSWTSPSGICESERKAFEKLCKEEKGIPEFLRDEILGDLEGSEFPKGHNDYLQGFLLADSTVPPELVEKLALGSSASIRQIALEHPNAPEGLLEALLTDGSSEASRLAWTLAKEPEKTTVNLDAQWLRRLQLMHLDHLNLNLAIARHPASTPEMWLHSLKHFERHDKLQVLEVLSTRDEAKEVPEVLDFLLKSRAKDVMSNMLSAELKPATFTKVLSRLYSSDSDLARESLTGIEVPEGSRIPRRMIEEMLASESRNERLAIISALGKTKQEVPQSKKQTR